MKNLCHLCGKNPPIENSHIIPRSVSNAIARQCGGHKYRYSEFPNTPTQDTMTYPLLCNVCETKFEVLERNFAEKYLAPYLNDDLESITLDEKTYQLFISVLWRALRIHLLLPHEKIIFSYMIDAEEIWRKYLLGDCNSPSDYNLYLLMDKDFSEDIRKKYPSLLMSHLRYSLGFNVSYISKNDLLPSYIDRHFSFVKLGPFMVFGELFSMEKLKGNSLPPDWQALMCEPVEKIRGVISNIPSDLIQYLSSFLKFSLDRVSSISERQKENQKKFIDKKLDRSKAKEIILADRRHLSSLKDNEKDNKH